MNHCTNRFRVRLTSLLLALFPFLSLAQQLPTTDKNVVRIEVPRVSVKTHRALSELSLDQKNISYAYTDGLGRPTVNVSAHAGVNGEDLVSFSQYNPVTGRQDRAYLPYAKTTSNPGAFVSNPVSEQSSFYTSATGIAHDSKPYGTTTWDVRNRVKTTTPTGSVYHDNNKKNTRSYEVYVRSTHGPLYHWVIENGLPKNDRYYRDKEVTFVENINPQGNRTRTIANFRGLTITSQIYDANTGQWHGSYNVYDDLGRLRFVVPPALVSTLDGTFPNSPTATQVDELCFETRYNKYGHVTQQHAPGAGWTYRVYDRWDRVVLSRHEAQKSGNNNQWTFVKYDILNRQVMSGVLESNHDLAWFQTQLDNSNLSRYETRDGSAHGYTQNSSYPRSQDFGSYELHAISYFDDYGYLSNNGWDTEGHNFGYVRPAGFPAVTLASSQRLTDKPTGSKTRVLGTSNWLNTVIHYDHKGRAIQTISENHVNGVDRLTSDMDWEGQLQKHLLEHSGQENLTLLSEYEYYTNGRAKRTYQTINSQPRTLAVEYHYNALGELTEKDLHGNHTGANPSFLQSVDYQYDIRGAMTHINNENLNDGENDLFGMRYLLAGQSTSVAGATVPARYDGLVSTLMWNTKNNTPSVNPSGGPKGNSASKSAVGYSYDERNRLKDTRTANWNGSSWNSNNNHYSTSQTYDDNDNLQTLTRKEGNTTIDDLNYTYETSSNKLKAVRDNSNNPGGLDEHYTGATDYDYDDMGNQTEDANKQINAIEYNHLQLVDRIEFTDGTEVLHTYDAAGNRLSKTVMNADNQPIARVDYVGLVEYLDDEINTLAVAEGRAYKQNGTFHREYHHTDHQGNLRVAFGDLPERFVHTATMESENSAKEESHFTFPATNVRTTAHNHTPLQDESARLNGAVSSRRTGPMKVLNISAGDEVDMEVWAKYTTGSWSNSSVGGMASTIVSAFGAAASGTGAESAASSLNSALNNAGSNLFTSSTQSQGPRAYLQYVFFNSSHQYQSSGSGFVAVTSGSLNKFTKLKAPTKTFTQDGYLLIYVANETNQNAEVYFDDIRIVHGKSQTAFRVTQTNEYYPFGLVTDKCWRAEGYADPGLLYQSSYASYDSLTGYYDFLSRSYDPALGRFFAVDPAGQFSSPYAGMGNLPHWGTDPDGEFFGLVKVGSIVRGIVNTVIQDKNGNVDDFGDGLRAFGSGFASGVLNNAASVAANPLGALPASLTGDRISQVQNGLEGTASTFGLIGAGIGLAKGVSNGDWKMFRNAVRLEAGRYYTDGNRSFWQQTWQGVSRENWEAVQTDLGHTYSQLRNATGGVDRVDYFGGATFATNENGDKINGISIGNFINIRIDDEINGSFRDRVLADPLFMHEFGHSFDSRIFGPSYLLAIGVPSLATAFVSKQVIREPTGVSTHSLRKHEIRANRHANRYFSRIFGVDWNSPYRGGTIETYYPTRPR